MKNLVLLGGGYGNMWIMLCILFYLIFEGYYLILIDCMLFYGLKFEFYVFVVGIKFDKEVWI